jgi:hypothetical protein
VPDPNTNERMARMRAHRRDDHSLCLPKNCEYSGMVGHSRGARLEADLLAERTMSAAEREIVRAISRTADEIDELEDYLAGRKGRWLSAVLDDLNGELHVQVEVDNVLAHLDRKRGTLTRLMSELRQYGVAAARASASNGPAGPGGAPKGSGPLTARGGADDLAAIRRRAAERRRAT